MIQEITAQELNAERFIGDKVIEIQRAVDDGLAINALSGGVDSSTVTMLGHRALGARLVTVFIDNGLMREGEPEQVAGLFQGLGVAVRVVDARQEFYAALAGSPTQKQARCYHPDLLPRGVRTYRQGERRRVPPPGDHPDRRGRDRGGHQAPAQRLRAPRDRSRRRRSDTASSSR